MPNSQNYNIYLPIPIFQLMEELKLVQGQLTERDTLITEQGLTIVIVENSDGSDARRQLVSVCYIYNIKLVYIISN